MSFQRCRAAIQAAPSKETVVSLLRDCMAQVPRQVRGALPLTCQHVLEAHPSNIEEAAIDLLRSERHFAGERTAAIYVREIAQTYAVAAAQIAKIGAE